MPVLRGNPDFFETVCYYSCPEAREIYGLDALVHVLVARPRKIPCSFVRIAAPAIAHEAKPSPMSSKANKYSDLQSNDPRHDLGHGQRLQLPLRPLEFDRAYTIGTMPLEFSSLSSAHCATGSLPLTKLSSSIGVTFRHVCCLARSIAVLAVRGALVTS